MAAAVKQLRGKREDGNKDPALSLSPSSSSVLTRAHYPSAIQPTCVLIPASDRLRPWAMEKELMGPPSLAGVRCRSAGSEWREQGAWQGIVLGLCAQQPQIGR